MEGRYNTLLEAGIILLLSANIVFLDIAVFGKIIPSETAAPISVTASDTCDVSCRQAITDIVNARIATQTAKPADIRPKTTGITTPKEYYVPLGSGATNNDQWKTVAGVEATIDTSLYPKIKQVVFESYLRIPVGIGWMHVKLYNVTDGHDVWNSEVSSESNTAAFKSSAITLDPGNKRYAVMALSTIRADAFIDNARIKIITY